jgi:hypothetical protein
MLYGKNLMLSGPGSNPGLHDKMTANNQIYRGCKKNVYTF